MINRLPHHPDRQLLSHKIKQLIAFELLIKLRLYVLIDAVLGSVHLITHHKYDEITQHSD